MKELEKLLYDILIHPTLPVEQKTRQFILILGAIRKIREEVTPECKSYVEKATPVLEGLKLDIPHVSCVSEADLLPSAEAVVNTKQHTLLMVAAAKGYLAIVQALISEKVNLNALDKFGASALGHAIAGMMLLNVVDEEKLPENALELIKISLYGPKIMVKQQHDIVRCLIEAKADLHAGKFNLLASALEVRGEESAFLLVQADYPLYNPYELFCGAINAINAAPDVTNVRLIDALIRRNLDINAASRDGMTILMQAASIAHSAVVKRLLIAGAKLESTTKAGKTALDYAIKNQRHFVTVLLMMEGAVINNVTALHKHMDAWPVTQRLHNKFHYCKGLAYEKENKYQNALEHYQKALAKGFQPALTKLMGLVSSIGESTFPKASPHSLLTSGSHSHEVKIGSSSLAKHTLDQCFLFIICHPSVNLTFEQWMFIAAKVSTADATSHFSLAGRRRFALDAAKKADAVAHTSDEKDKAKVTLHGTWLLFHKSTPVEMAENLGDIIADYSDMKESKKVAIEQLMRP